MTTWSLPPSPLGVDELAAAVCQQLPAGADIVLPISNGEPVRLLDAIESRLAEDPALLEGVRVHQMHTLRDRPYLHGAFQGRLDHVSWFLSHITRSAFHAGTCEFAPANFSEVPAFLAAKQPALVLAAASPPDRHGYFSLGLSADYVVSLIGKVPFVLESNPAMPSTHGANRLHRSEVLAWCEAESELVEVPAPLVDDADRAVATFVAERIPNGATIQLGIGSIPTAVAGFLRDHRDLGVHTELLSDPIVDLVESGVVTGVRKRSYRGRVVTTFALGSRRLYDFCDDNASVVFLGVDEVNDPRNIGREPNFISVNATLEVDLFGQYASESIGSHLWSGSGGQADFARGAQYSTGGDGFVVLHATAKGGTLSRIVPCLQPGAIVTTQKNTVDNVVTEHGVAALRGRTVSERAAALIAIAAPEHREALTRAGRDMGLLR